MDFRHLRTALVLAEELHFGRTAKRLRVAQSAVSQTIKALEDEIGALLFVRTKRKVELTSAGEEVVRRARDLLREAEELPVQARRAASGETGHLRLRFIATSVLTDMPRVIARFRRRHPAVQVQVSHDSSVAQLEAIRAGTCDVGFMALANSKAGLAPLSFKVIAKSPMLALVPVRHPFARREAVSLAELAAEPFVFLALEDEPQINRLFRQRCVNAGIDLNVAIEVQHTDALLAFVAAGFGVSCAPAFTRRLSYPGVTAIALEPSFPSGIIAVWHEQRISATGRRFLEMLAEVDVTPGTRG